MRIAQATRIGIWLLIYLNLLMSLGSLWIFMRMSPAIREIIEQNEHSLQACEDMLVSFVMLNNNDITTNKIIENKAANTYLDAYSTRQSIYNNFKDALKRARNNITEPEESTAIKIIDDNFFSAFNGEINAKEKAVSAIILLGKINREAMIKADLRARQFGQGGAWGIVFMATSVFFAGVLFKRNLLRNLLAPIEEIHSVIYAHRNGDTMRRCSGADLPADFVSVFHGINEILDQSQSQFAQKTNFYIKPDIGKIGTVDYIEQNREI